MSVETQIDAIQGMVTIVEQVLLGTKEFAAAREEISRYSLERRPSSMSEKENARFDALLTSALRLIDSWELHRDDLRNKALYAGLEALRRQAERV